MASKMMEDEKRRRRRSFTKEYKAQVVALCGQQGKTPHGVAKELGLTATAVRAWVTRGWSYLAILVDLCTRSIVGWAVSDHCDTELALRALDAAVARCRPPPGLLHHTDRGATYTAGAYRERLDALGMTASMSRRGNCWDNSVAEATFGSIKAELLDGWIPESGTELAAELFVYIEAFYNRRRLHSAIGYLTPAEMDAKLSEQRFGKVA